MRHLQRPLLPLPLLPLGIGNKDDPMVRHPHPPLLLLCPLGSMNRRWDPEFEIGWETLEWDEVFFSGCGV